MIVEGQPRMPLFFANASRRSWKRHFDRLWFFFPTHLTHCLPYNATPGVQERALPWDLPPHVFWDPPPRWSNPCWSAVSQLLEADLLHHYDHPDHYGRTWLKSTPSPAGLWEPKRLTLHLPTFRDETSPWLLSKPGHCHGAYIPTRFGGIEKDGAIDYCRFIEVQGSETRTQCNKSETEPRRLNWRIWSIVDKVGPPSSGLFHIFWTTCDEKFINWMQSRNMSTLLQAKCHVSDMRSLPKPFASDL